MEEQIAFQDLESVHYSYYLALVSFTILYYDYFLTFPWEVERVWKTSGLNWATGFFYFNRYLCLLGHIPVIIEYFWSTSSPRKNDICHELQTFHQYLAVVIQVIVACMLVMRVYALYGGRRFVLFLYIFIMGAALIISSWSLIVGMKTEARQDVYLPIGCGPNMTHYFAIRTCTEFSNKRYTRSVHYIRLCHCVGMHVVFRSPCFLDDSVQVRLTTSFKRCKFG